MKKYTLVGPFAQLLPMTGLRLKGPVFDTDLPLMENAGLLLENEKIHALGPYTEMLSRARDLKADEVVLKGDHICIPGLVDAHTHICFAGSRARDYALRNAGKSYLEIAKAGGGIWDTVTQTRKASQTDLVEGIV